MPHGCSETILCFCGRNLWLGLICVLEWPKDADEDRGDEEDAMNRDMNNVYLVTSRDGVHVDDEVRHLDNVVTYNCTREPPRTSLFLGETLLCFRL